MFIVVNYLIKQLLRVVYCAVYIYKTAQLYVGHNKLIAISSYGTTHSNNFVWYLYTIYIYITMLSNLQV